MINGWGILGIILIVATIVFGILASREKGITFAILMFISLLLSVFSAVSNIVGVFNAKKNITYHKALSLTVETTGPIFGYERFEESVSKSNEWLEDANKNLDTFGIFSIYYGTELEELDYIIIPEDE